MKTLMKTAVVTLVLIFTYTFSFSQNDTSKTAVGKTIDKVENAIDGDRADVDHNHNALMEHVDDLMEKVANMELTGYFDKDYAKMMIEYHQAGIDMAQAEVNKGNNDNLKERARQTIDWQKEEIDQLRAFMNDYKETGKKHDVAIIKNAMQENLNKMHQVKISGDIDKDFAKIMNLHHKGAIGMHKLQLEHGMDAKLKAHAQNSLSEQEKDMAELKEFDVDVDVDVDKK